VSTASSFPQISVLAIGENRFGSPFGKEAVLGRRVVDEHVVGEVPRLVHDWTCPGW
jgi:hypothetical protein